MGTTIVIDSAAGSHMLIGDEYLIVTQTGVLTSSTLAGNGVTAIFSSSGPVDIVVEGTIIADANAIEVANSHDGSTVQVSSGGSLFGDTGIFLNLGGAANVSVNGQIIANVYGIDSLGDGNSIVIGATGSISAGSHGIFSTGATAAIANAGSITAFGAGMRIEGVNSTVSNTGTVYGENNGVYVVNSSAVLLTNSGEITGGSGLRLKDVAGTSTLINDGALSGQGNSGLYLEGSDARAMNNGTISGVINGIYVTTSGTNAVDITNSGTISGGTNSIRMIGDSAFSIDNSGVMVGDVLGGALADTLVNSGRIQGDVRLGGGDDIFRGIDAGQVSGLVDGGFGNDTIRGSSLSDNLLGGDGDDLLHGRDGDDVLGGGAGADTLGGGRGDDELIGGGATDVLLGGRGDDVLNGGAGGDKLVGGKGDDTLIGGGGKDNFVFRAASGNDTISDFQDNKDTLKLDQTLWGGGLLLSEVLTNYATVIGVDVVFQFDGGESLVVEGMVAVNFLADDILLI